MIDNRRIKAAWDKHQETRVALLQAINDMFKVGDKVEVLGPKDKWVPATVAWVPYINGPTVTYIHVHVKGHKASRAWHMGGGHFNGIRWPIQPMETAPKDGTEIVLHYPDGSSIWAFWSERPVCMGGPTVYQKPQWASGPSGDTDTNLPCGDCGEIGWSER